MGEMEEGVTEVRKRSGLEVLPPPDSIRDGFVLFDSESNVVQWAVGPDEENRYSDEKSTLNGGIVLRVSIIKRQGEAGVGCVHPTYFLILGGRASVYHLSGAQDVEGVGFIGPIGAGESVKGSFFGLSLEVYGKRSLVESVPTVVSKLTLGDFSYTDPMGEGKSVPLKYWFAGQTGKFVTPNGRHLGGYNSAVSVGLVFSPEEVREKAFHRFRNRGFHLPFVLPTALCPRPVVEIESVSPAYGSEGLPLPHNTKIGPYMPIDWKILNLEDHVQRKIIPAGALMLMINVMGKEGDYGKEACSERENKVYEGLMGILAMQEAG